MEALAKHTTQEVDARKVGARGLANIAHGAARSSGGKHVGAVFTALARAATEQRMRDFNSQNLANTAWALTDSAACALGSCRSVAMGGELGGMGRQGIP